jgi:Putative lumazine-binding
MKPILFLLTFISCAAYVNAQSAEDSVKAAINKLFEGMKNANAALVSDAFSDSAILQTLARNKEGKLIIKNEQVKAFAEFVGRQHKGAADERISFETIKIDGPLAIAWTPYKFYYEGKFSHCGVNSFQLVQVGGQWKIQYLIDTRRRQGCE